MNRFIQKMVRHQKNWYGQWHTWAGIFSGSILLLVGLSGALLVFEQELDVWLNPDLFQYEKTGERLSFQTVTERVQAAKPDLQITGIFKDELRNDIYLLSVKNDQDEFRQLYANPHTGEVTGMRVYQESVMGFIRNFHRTLLIPTAGRYLVGTAAFICAILMITGLRLWIPRQWKNLKARLGVKWGASQKRVNYDLHNSLGFYFSPAITLMALTGVMITFSQIILLFMFLLNFESPQSIEQVLNQRSVYLENTDPISITKAIAQAQVELPEAKITGVGLPQDSLGSYTINVKSDYVTKTGNRDLVFVDQYSAGIIGTSRAAPYKLAKSYLNWVQPLHYGTFGGLPTRILALIGSLVMCFLFISGFYIWLPRWKKRRAMKDTTSSPIQINQNQPYNEKETSLI